LFREISRRGGEGDDLQPNEKQMQKKLANIMAANDDEKMLGFNINLTVCKQ
jgi:hypothetical protein